MLNKAITSEKSWREVFYDVAQGVLLTCTIRYHYSHSGEKTNYISYF